MDTIKYADLPGTKKLIADYTGDPGALSGYFSYAPFSPESYTASRAAKLASYTTDRKALARVLTEQNRRWGGSEKTLENIKLLEDDRTFAVVTGQQAGVLSGPLYMIYKALTTIRLSQKLDQDLPGRCVPVFWVVSDDHDLAEIDHVNILGRDDQVHTVTYQTGPENQGDSAFSLQVKEEEWAVFREGIKAQLPETEFSDGLFTELLDTAYEPGRSVVDAFACLTHRLFKEYGIIIMDVARDGLKALGRPVFENELQNPLHSTGLVEQAGQDLIKGGWHQQIQPNPRGLNLFLRKEGKRHKLEYDGKVFSAGDDQYQAAEIRDLLRTDPDSFSTGVVLRPVLQDFLLPTIAYVGGPGEVAYFAQLKEVFACFEVPMPVIQLRCGFTLLEKRIVRLLEKYQVAPDRLFDPPETLVKEIVREGSLKAFDRAMQRTREELGKNLERLLEDVKQVDPTLEGTMRSSRGKLNNILENLEKKVVQARKRSDATLGQQVGRLAAAVRPGGRLQERVLNIFQYLNLYGMELMGKLYEATDPENGEHALLKI